MIQVLKGYGAELVTGKEIYDMMNLIRAAARSRLISIHCRSQCRYRNQISLFSLAGQLT